MFCAAAIGILWVIASATSEPLRRVRRSACHDEKHQIAFAIAQRNCIEKTATNMGNPPDSADVEKDYKNLLNYYTIRNSPDDETFVPFELQSKFEKCFLKEAKKLLAKTGLEEKDYDKEFRKGDILAELEKTNKLKCQLNMEANTVIDQAYIDQLHEKWDRLSIFQRAFKTVVAKMFALLNPNYVECFSKINDLKIPQLLCAKDQAKDAIVEKLKCFRDSLLPAGKQKLDAAAATKPDEKMVNLGKVSQLMLNTLLCDDPKAKPESSGSSSSRSLSSSSSSNGRTKKQKAVFGLKILATMPAATIIGIVSIPVAAIVCFGIGFVACADPKVSNGSCSICGGALAAGGGAIFGVCLLLYCVFGLPWVLLYDVINGRITPENYDADRFLKLVTFDEDSAKWLEKN